MSGGVASGQDAVLSRASRSLYLFDSGAWGLAVLGCPVFRLMFRSLGIGTRFLKQKGGCSNSWLMSTGNLLRVLLPTT